jgi:HAD superfamily hydrolase (TIGR01549 family)
MRLNLNRIEALCFDVDGTLRDTDDQVVEQLTKILYPVRFLFPEHNPKPAARRFVMSSENLGNWMIGLPDRLNFDHHIERLLLALEHLKPNKNHKRSLIIPGVREMLIELQSTYPMAIVSAGRRGVVEAFLEQYELTELFTCVATAQTCHRTKPYPDPIIWCAERMGVAPQNCLMVGDTTVDIRAGSLAGAQTVGVLCGFGEENELLRTGADLILENTADLQGKLLKKPVD